MIDYQNAVSQIKDTLYALRPKLMEAYGNTTYDTKEDGSPVTKLDLEVELTLTKVLKEISDIEVYGEETAVGSPADTTWLIDPIDGTESFIRGIPQCCNIISLMENNQINLTVIYNFVTDECFHAIRGKGAYRNGELIKVKTRALNESLVVYESKSERERKFSYLDQLNEVIPHGNVFMHEVTGYHAGLVASGGLDGIIYQDSWEELYDISGSGLLVEEAGGIVRNLNSDTYDFHNLDFVMTNSELYSALKKADLV